MKTRINQLKAPKKSDRKVIKMLIELKKVFYCLLKKDILKGPNKQVLYAHLSILHAIVFWTHKKC